MSLTCHNLGKDLTSPPPPSPWGSQDPLHLSLDTLVLKCHWQMHHVGFMWNQHNASWKTSPRIWSLHFTHKQSPLLEHLFSLSLSTCAKTQGKLICGVQSSWCLEWCQGKRPSLLCMCWVRTVATLARWCCLYRKWILTIRRFSVCDRWLTSKSAWFGDHLNRKRCSGLLKRQHWLSVDQRTSLLILLARLLLV